MISSTTCLNRTRLISALHIAGFFLLGPNSISSASAAERVELEVRETAGLARRGYPAQALLKLPHSVPATTKFRLLYDGKPIVAQFRPDGDKLTADWWLDFQTEMAPLERKKYMVEFGDKVAAGPERANGHKLTETAAAFAITNAPFITWTIPRDLKGFVRSIDFPPAEYLRPDSPGLVLRDRQGKDYPFSGTARVVRQGAMAVGLSFEVAKSETSPVRSVADLTFPAPVSWVEVDWNIDDPQDLIAAAGLNLHLNLDKATAAAPTLVDFGATSMVYTSLGPGQEADFNAGPLAEKGTSGDDYAWKILRGDRGRMLPFALGSKQSSPRKRVECWAHVMDRKICLALALDAFDRDARDRIITTADGTVALWREFSAAKKQADKRLHFWLHFVFFPPQASAGASPQQMLTPLAVRVTKP